MAGLWISGVTFATYVLVLDTCQAVHMARTESGANRHPNTIRSVATGPRQPILRRCRAAGLAAPQLLDFGTQPFKLSPFSRAEWLPPGADNDLPPVADTPPPRASCPRTDVPAPTAHHLSE
jgi:hypothetical protein